MNFSNLPLHGTLCDSIGDPFSRYVEPYERIGDFGFLSDEKKSRVSLSCHLLFNSRHEVEMETVECCGMYVTGVGECVGVVTLNRTC